MNPKSLQYVSECFVKPQYITEEMKKPCYLTPWDLSMLSVHYIQKGLLFAKRGRQAAADDEENFIGTLLDGLKDSLSLTLVHFYPLAGRLRTVKTESPPSYVVFVDIDNSPGAKLIYATLDMTTSDILSPTCVPLVVQSFFDHDRAVNHDGHFRPLLSVQVTVLLDGVFIGLSMNHSLGDGTSFWNFFNAWSETFQAEGKIITPSCPPVIKRWFPDGHDAVINLPFIHHDEFVSRHEAPKFIERFLHFTAESIAKLKSKANATANTNKFSSLQSLSALVWRCITRARNLPHDQTTSCMLAINDRPRLEPPLSQYYFGCSVEVVKAVATAGELLDHDLGWATWKLHEAVVSHNDKRVRVWLEEWRQSPIIFQHRTLIDPYSVMVGSSPKFKKYEIEFGLGKALAIRSGYANKIAGNLMAYPGREGGGSIDLEVCLSPDSMSALEQDEEFMDAAS